MIQYLIRYFTARTLYNSFSSKPSIKDNPMLRRNYEKDFHVLQQKFMFLLEHSVSFKLDWEYYLKVCWYVQLWKQIGLIFGFAGFIFMMEGSIHPTLLLFYFIVTAFPVAFYLSNYARLKREAWDWIEYSVKSTEIPKLKKKVKPHERIIQTKGQERDSIQHNPSPEWLIDFDSRL